MQLLKQLGKARSVQVAMMAVVPLVFSVPSMLLNTYALTALLHLYRKNGEAARKRYIFMISRAFSSLTSLLGLWSLVALTFSTVESYGLMATFFIIQQLSFFASVGSYVAMTVMLYVAVVHPFVYRRVITLFVCKLILAGIWGASALNAVIMGLLEATIFFPDAPIRCSYEDCQVPATMYTVIALSSSYILNIVLFLLTICALRRRDRDAAERGDIGTSTTLAVKRLAWALVAFSFMAASMITVSCMMIVHLHRIVDFEDNLTYCNALQQSDFFLTIIIISGCLTLLWVSGVVADPLLGIIFDERLSKLVAQQARQVHKSIKPLFVGQPALAK